MKTLVRDFVPPRVRAARCRPHRRRTRSRRTHSPAQTGGAAMPLPIDRWPPVGGLARAAARAPVTAGPPPRRPSRHGVRFADVSLTPNPGQLPGGRHPPATDQRPGRLGADPLAGRPGDRGGGVGARLALAELPPVVRGAPHGARLRAGGAADRCGARARQLLLPRRARASIDRAGPGPPAVTEAAP